VKLIDANVLIYAVNSDAASDAHLAAHALEGGWTLVSTDNDFRRFSGLNVLSPTSA